jgi:metal-responsive CopG/Arc/MetJ family transcriptional regulator
MRESDVKKSVGITVDKRVLDEIDERRGLIKRSTYVNDLLRNVVCKNPDVSEERGKS